jgi:hypothetical protein
LIGNNRYQKVTIFRIGEMVSVGSIDTYNLLSTDTKNYFCSSVFITEQFSHILRALTQQCSGVSLGFPWVVGTYRTNGGAHSKGVIHLDYHLYRNGIVDVLVLFSKEMNEMLNHHRSTLK